MPSAHILGGMARANCPECNGTGWRVVEYPNRAGGARAFAAPESARPGAAQGEPKTVWAVPCECAAEDRLGMLFRRARIPERYRHCDFDSFDTDLPYDHGSEEELAAWNHSLKQAKLVVQGFARDFPVGVEHGLLLLGPCGVGKTHLGVAALREIVLRGHTGMFYDYRDLLKQVQNSYHPESQATEMGVLDPVLSAEVLLLDDLGSSKPSLWALEMIGHILSARYNERRVTLLTTNFLDAETRAVSVTAREGQRPATIEDTLTDRIGNRIRSRLYEMCRTVEIVAPDYRKEIRHAGRYRA